MYFWTSFGVGGFICVGTCIAVAVVLIFWRERRRGDCPRCGHVNLSHAVYCGHCGNPLADGDPPASG